MLTRRFSLAALLGAGAAASLSGSRALAHHGFTGLYDTSRPIFIEGMVRAASFRRPHPELTLLVDASLALPLALDKADEFLPRLVLPQEDAGKDVTIELPPVSLFFDLRGRISRGDRIAVIAYRNCREPHQLRGQWLRLADGTVVVRSGRMQTETDSCPAS